MLVNAGFSELGRLQVEAQLRQPLLHVLIVVRMKARERGRVKIIVRQHRLEIRVRILVFVVNVRTEIALRLGIAPAVHGRGKLEIRQLLLVKPVDEAAPAADVVPENVVFARSRVVDVAGPQVSAHFQRERGIARVVSGRGPGEHAGTLVKVEHDARLDRIPKRDVNLRAQKFPRAPVPAQIQPDAHGRAVEAHHRKRRQRQHGNARDAEHRRAQVEIILLRVIRQARRRKGNRRPVRLAEVKRRVGNFREFPRGGNLRSFEKRELPPAAHRPRDEALLRAVVKRRAQHETRVPEIQLRRRRDFRRLRPRVVNHRLRVQANRSRRHVDAAAEMLHAVGRGKAHRSRVDHRVRSRERHGVRVGAVREGQPRGADEEQKRLRRFFQKLRADFLHVFFSLSGDEDAVSENPNDLPLPRNKKNAFPRAQSVPARAAAAIFAMSDVVEKPGRNGRKRISVPASSSAARSEASSVSSV